MEGISELECKHTLTSFFFMLKLVVTSSIQHHSIELTNLKALITFTLQKRRRYTKLKNESSCF